MSMRCSIKESISIKWASSFKRFSISFNSLANIYSTLASKRQPSIKIITAS